MDAGAWWAAVHGVAKSRTRLSDFTFTFHFHALEKEMATHSSVPAWRIPGMAELPSAGSHRVGHDWSDLAAAAAAQIQVSKLTHYHLSGSVWASAGPAPPQSLLQLPWPLGQGLVNSIWKAFTSADRPSLSLGTWRWRETGFYHISWDSSSCDFPTSCPYFPSDSSGPDTEAKASTGSPVFRIP